MRPLRRSLALLLHLLLLQATVLGGGAACASRAAGSVHTPQAAHEGETQSVPPGTHHGGHGPRHEAPGAGAERGAYEGDRAPDGHSDAPLHCGLAAACLTPALASRAAPLPLRTAAPARERAAQDAAPRSTSLAPEPPPPRA